MVILIIYPTWYKVNKLDRIGRRFCRFSIFFDKAAFYKIQIEKKTHPRRRRRMRFFP